MRCGTLVLFPYANALLQCVNWAYAPIAAGNLSGVSLERARRGFSWCGRERIYRTAAESVSRGLCASSVHRSKKMHLNG